MFKDVEDEEENDEEEEEDDDDEVDEAFAEHWFHDNGYADL